MKRRRRYLGCTIEAHKGHWRVRFRWKGRRYARTTTYPATPETRARVEALAKLIVATIDAGKNPLPLVKPATTPAQTPKRGQAVREYYQCWINDKVPPMVRKAQARDYRRHIERYVLPTLSGVALADLSARDILAFGRNYWGAGCH